MKKTSVGLVILADIPTMGGLNAVLQERGKFNHEENRPESWPGACQVTAHGKCTEGESIKDGLMREIYEELGAAMAEVIADVAAHNVVELNRVETDEKLVVTFGCRFAAYTIFGEDPFKDNVFRLHESSGGLRMVNRQGVDKIVDLAKNFNKVDGVKDPEITAMFADEKEAVRLAFEKLS